MHDDGGNDDRNQVDDFDHWVEGWSRSVFERIADGVADDAGFVAFGAFARVFGRVFGFIFDQFFRIIPGPTGVVEEDGQQLPGENDASEEPPQGFDLEEEADNNRGDAFHEVRLPRSVTVTYPRDPLALAEEWMKRGVLLVAEKGGKVVGYVSAEEDRVSGIARMTDLVVAPEARRQGVASALLSTIQAWALERGVGRILIEMQSKNYPCIRLAQKFGYEFCGYNDKYYPTQDVALFFGRAIK